MLKCTCFLSSLLPACSSVSGVNLNSQASEEELKSSFMVLKETKTYGSHVKSCVTLSQPFLYLKSVRKMVTKLLAGTVTIGQGLRAFINKRVNLD